MERVLRPGAPICEAPTSIKSLLPKEDLYMRFGLFGGGKIGKMNPLGDSHGYRDFIEYVKEADRLGYESVFLVEHHFTGVGQLSASLNLLTYIAAVTKRLRMGTAVLVLPWHNPALLAGQVATPD